jgi:site-specific DNA-methyltransferase (adenine-specific)
MDGLALLQGLPDGSASAAFFDPQHRAILDRQRYGNEGARQSGRASLPAMSEATIAEFMVEIDRVVKPSGYVFAWIDKFLMATGRYRAWISDVHLYVVDVVVWNKLRMGMGRRARCQSEFCVVLQRAPLKADGTWSDHALPDCWAEQQDRDLHPHAKPYQLTERLIRATTKRGDLVLDPCAGSYVVLEACKASGRDFIGCDIGVEK